PPNPVRSLEPLGNETTLNKITRDDIVAFQDKYYRPDSMIIAVVGDIKKDQVVELFKKNFGSWKKDGTAPLFHISPVELPKERIRKVINMPGKSQVEIAIGSKGLSRTNPDYYAAVVMNYILGENTLGSRMGLQIRDKEGLAYGVSSYFYPSIGEGPWVVRMGVNPKNVERAVEAALKEIKRIQDSPVTDGELDDARKYLIGRLPVSLETNSGIASMLITEELYGLGLDFVEKFPKIYQSITKEQIQKAAKKYLHPDRLVIIIAGPYEK
ncbi:MAG: insulinase family protein, partial [Firmicutes bacterium]|nr:insulinase family protein [Bacillota bacterium]